jgi:hypothetical protein
MLMLSAPGLECLVLVVYQLPGGTWENLGAPEEKKMVSVTLKISKVDWVILIPFGKYNF